MPFVRMAGRIHSNFYLIAKVQTMTDITVPRILLKQALNALGDGVTPGAEGAITALRRALANTQEPSQDAEDAARYRWLRNEVKDWYIGPSYGTYNDIVCDGKYLDLSAGGAELDYAIDTTRSKGKNHD